MFAAFSLRVRLDRRLFIRNKTPASRVLMPEGTRKAAANRRETLMGFIIWIVIGGIVGWLASLVMRTDGQQGILLNIVVGIVGAFIASMIISKGNINTSNPLDITNILVSLVGAIILLGIVNLIRRGSVR